MEGRRKSILKVNFYSLYRFLMILKFYSLQMATLKELMYKIVAARQMALLKELIYRIVAPNTEQAGLIYQLVSVKGLKHGKII